MIKKFKKGEKFKSFKEFLNYFENNRGYYFKSVLDTSGFPTMPFSLLANGDFSNYAPAIEVKERETTEGGFEIGEEVTVYNRYLFAVPAKGYIVGISSMDQALQVVFPLEENKNVRKHSGKYFFKEECRKKGSGNG